MAADAVNACLNDSGRATDALLICDAWAMVDAPNCYVHDIVTVAIASVTVAASIEPDRTFDHEPQKRRHHSRSLRRQSLRTSSSIRSATANLDSS